MQFQNIPELFQFVLFRSFPKGFHFPLSGYTDKHRQNAMRPINLILSWKYKMAVIPINMQTKINAQCKIYLYSRLIKWIVTDEKSRNRDKTERADKTESRQVQTHLTRHNTQTARQSETEESRHAEAQ